MGRRGVRALRQISFGGSPITPTAFRAARSSRSGRSSRRSTAPARRRIRVTCCARGLPAGRGDGMLVSAGRAGHRGRARGRRRRTATAPPSEASCCSPRGTPWPATGGTRRPRAPCSPAAGTTAPATSWPRTETGSSLPGPQARPDHQRRHERVPVRGRAGARPSTRRPAGHRGRLPRRASGARPWWPTWCRRGAGAWRRRADRVVPRPAGRLQEAAPGRVPRRAAARLLAQGPATELRDALWQGQSRHIG